MSADGSRLAGGVVILLVVVHCAWMTLWLVGPHVPATYPFLLGDSCDWIATGLNRAGFDTQNGTRPPLFPLVVAGAAHLGLLAWLPVVDQLAMAVGSLLLFRILHRRHGAEIAAWISLAFFFGARYQAWALPLMADHLAAALLFVSLVIFRRARRWTRLYAAAGLAAGLSAVAQQTALLLLLPLGIVVWKHRRRDLRTPWLWVGLLGCLAPPVAWFVEKKIVFGRFGDVTTKHWNLLGWNPQGLAYYARKAPEIFGWPLLLLVLAGTWLLLRRRGAGDRNLVYLGSAATIAIFFGLFYRWTADRFVVYVYLLLAIPAAVALSSIRPVGLRRTVAAAALVAAAWPATGITDGWRSLPAVEAWSARHAAAAPGRPELDASVAHHAVFLHAPWRSVGDRYFEPCRMGILLRRRVSWVPAETVPPTWWGWSRARRAGELLGHPTWLFPSPASGESILLVGEKGSEIRSLGEGRERTPAPADVEVIWSDARELRDRLDHPDEIVGLLSRSDGGEEWIAASLTLGTPRLFVALGDDSEAMERRVRQGDRSAWARVGRYAMRRVIAMGWRAREIRTAEEAGLPEVPLAEGSGGAGNEARNPADVE